MVLPEINLNEIQYLDINLVQTDAHFITGFNYLSSHYSQVLSGATAEKIGKVSKDGAIYYVIIFKTSHGYFEGIYSLKSDGSVEF